jgi:RNA polymerase sigma factor (TIGR02999 family)
MIRKLMSRLVNPGKPQIGAVTGEVTEVLRRWAGGDSEAGTHLASLLYPELRRIAEGRMRCERADHTLQPTALVSEFFVQLARQKTLKWKNRAHFLAVASKAMRNILVDHARAHKSEKRGGAAARMYIDDLGRTLRTDPSGMLELDDLLDRLEREEPRMAKVVELRCFGGLTHSEIGEILGVDERTAKRDWQVARAWLMGQLKKGNGHDG